MYLNTLARPLFLDLCFRVTNWILIIKKWNSLTNSLSSHYIYIMIRVYITMSM